MIVDLRKQQREHPPIHIEGTAVEKVVFLKEELEHRLEKEREEVRRQAGMVIRAHTQLCGKESRQMEEILRLEKEIERLQRQKEDGVSMLGTAWEGTGRSSGRGGTQRSTGWRRRRLAWLQSSWSSWTLGSGTESVQRGESPRPSESTAPLGRAEEEVEEVDEGFHAKEECPGSGIPLPDFPLPAEIPLDQELFSSLPPPPPAFAEGLVAQALALSQCPYTPPCSTSSPALTTGGGKALCHQPTRRTEVAPDINRVPRRFEVIPNRPCARVDVMPTTVPEAVPVRRGDVAPSRVDFMPTVPVPGAREEISFSILPDTESDCDQEEFEEVQGSTGSGDGASITDGHATDEEVLRKSSCTQNSLDSFRGSSDSFIDSDTSTDGYVDTDEEVSNGRVNILNGSGPPYFHSYLYMKGGLMIPWRRRWCVLKDETFMWFRAKQDSLKSGWLYKKGGGMSTLSRRNWKLRWFVLRDDKLMYFESDSEEKLRGTIDIRSAKDIVDNHAKENSLNIVTEERTYHIYAETPEDA
ncbi:unconventional myosin-X-like, partial [Oncorhynchus masou masou]|uniref:unconventional myosin-X-like n=1 Tax=Oncorhynchus masou masou TaxID=90313 RepID=UPI003182CB4F